METGDFLGIAGGKGKIWVCFGGRTTKTHPYTLPFTEISKDPNEFGNGEKTRGVYA